MPRMSILRSLALAIGLFCLVGCDIVASRPLPLASTAPTAPANPANPGGPAATAPSAPLSPAETEAAIGRARSLQREGRYDASAAAIAAVAPQNPQAASLLAENAARAGRWTEAADRLTAYLNGFPQAADRDRALFWLARTHEASGAHQAAIDAYQAYMALGTSLAPYAQLRIAAQQEALGQRELAAASYESAADSDLPPPEQAAALEQAIVLRRALNQPDAALVLATTLLDRATVADYRTSVRALAASIADDAGDDARARDLRLAIASDAPASDAAIAAVERLAAAGSPAPPATAAAVYAAHERWADAVTAYDAAIAADPQPDLQRRRALALRQTGDYAAALAALQQIAAAAPQSETGIQAALDAIQTLGQSGDAAGAAAAYLAFADTHAADDRAPEALDRAATLRERAGDAAGAQRLWLDLASRYPQSSQTESTIFGVGKARLDAGDGAGALAAWTVQSQLPDQTLAAQGAYWAARTAASSGDAVAAETLYRRARTLASETFYGLRAAEALGGLAQGKRQLDAPIDDAEWAAAAAWVEQWAPAAGVARGAIAEDPGVRRAIQLRAVALDVAAADAWNATLGHLDAEPRRLLDLAQLAGAGGEYRVALQAARQLARAAPASAGELPLAIQLLLYPAPYGELVQQYAAASGIPPCQFYALMRQESLFDPFATSPVGARGLTQMMPGTGQAIARGLKVDPFTDDDLYRPALSIRFGATYLAEQIAADGSFAGALAAYNAGPGNLSRWAALASPDELDMFVETVDFRETRQYVKLVYMAAARYNQLYRCG